MDIAVVLKDISPQEFHYAPWGRYQRELALIGIHFRLFKEEAAFSRTWDAMMAWAWQDWDSPRFNPRKVMPFLEKFTVYRDKHPEVLQIVLNHPDSSRHPWALPYWRRGDPIIVRTPPYDRSELAPFPAEDMFAYEKHYDSDAKGQPIFSEGDSHGAGLICTATGPSNYRKTVAAYTAKVGIGWCNELGRPLFEGDYAAVLSQCRILVCPRGYGGQTKRHWDAWRSRKPVLTDMECASCEMIPGMSLEAGKHYLVFKKPEDIPDIVSDWTRKSRQDDLRQIAENAYEALDSFDSLGRTLAYFKGLKERIVKR